jgi:adenylate cyclase
MEIPLNCKSEFEQQAVREQLDRILKSGPFSQSRRRQRFLKYIVNEMLAGRGDRLKGYCIAQEVFDRSSAFDANVDPVVRVEAGRLRDRLREYYEGDGRSDPICIDLPKGTYTPQIEFRQAVKLDSSTLRPVATTLDRGFQAPPSQISQMDGRPSVAVLPFVNMSADHAHDYLSDGITENIITGLSRFRDLAVIASYSAFSYKGKPLKIQDVASELGVRFVLEGSVQKSSGRVTITAQLIDGDTGAHLWAERFDRDVDDIISVLDEITQLIVGRLATTFGGRIRKAWRGRIQKSSPQNFQAYDHFQRGLDAFDFTPGSTARAREWFLRTIELDPNYGKAYAKVAWTYLTDIWLDWSENIDDSMEEALKYCTLALARDDDEAWGHWAMGAYHIFCGQHDRALASYQRALDLNPNDADVMSDFGWCLSCVGRSAEGMEMVHKAMRLNPHYPEYWLLLLGPVYFDARRYEDAIATFGGLQKIDTMGVHLYLAASHAALGHDNQARAELTRVFAFDPKASIRRCESAFLDVYKQSADREHFRQNLLKAGLPE